MLTQTAVKFISSDKSLIVRQAPVVATPQLTNIWISQEYENLTGNFRKTEPSF